jgi:hypothetical protein
VTAVQRAIGVSVVLDICSLAYHVVDDCIGVDSNTSGSTSLNHGSELSASAAARKQSVTNWLIYQIPWTELLVSLVVITAPNALRRRPNFDSHISGFSQKRTLLGHVIVWPSKQFHDATFLAVAKCALSCS